MKAEIDRYKIHFMKAVGVKLKRPIVPAPNWVHSKKKKS